LKAISCILSLLKMAVTSSPVFHKVCLSEGKLKSLQFLGNTGIWRFSKHLPSWQVAQVYITTPWCRILFEKLIVTQLVKKYPAFLWNPKVHYRVHTSPPPDPILSQLNSVRPIDPYLPKVHCLGRAKNQSRSEAL
jgi:hypothetical protein